MNENEKYCTGCGVKLQDENIVLEGYTTSIENDICMRCFRLKNYGEYQVITKSNEEYIEILKTVNQTKDLVLYIVDLLNLDRNLNEIKNYIHNNMILVLNKKDVLPKSVKEKKIIEYIKRMNLGFQDIIVISCEKNYNIDLLLKRIKYFQTTKNVYVVGHTNAGKSTLINKLIKNYSTNTQSELTISPLPSTTLNKISIDLNEYLTVIDTPGLVDRGNIANYVDSSIIKKLHAKKEIKPKTYQMRKGQSILIEDLIRIDYVEGARNSFTLYMSNDLKVKRLLAGRKETLHDLAKTSYEVSYRNDLVINGLGFIKIVNKGTIHIYIDKDVEVFLRNSII